MDNRDLQKELDEEFYQINNMLYFNAPKQQERIEQREAHEQRQAERVAKKKARAKKTAALVVAGTIAITGVVGTHVDNIKEGFDNIKEKFKVGQEYTDPLKELRERTGKTGEEIYDEYISYIQERRSEGFQVTQSEEGYRDFIENYDNYVIEEDVIKGARGQ